MIARARQPRPARSRSPAPPQPVQPAIPAATDAVCATWAIATNDYRTKEDAWAKTDPGIPAAQWSIQQRAITLDVIPVLRQEAADLRGFAAKASDPTLRFLMQLEAAYQEAFADRLPQLHTARRPAAVAGRDQRERDDQFAVLCGGAAEVIPTPLW